MRTRVENCATLGSLYAFSMPFCQFSAPPTSGMVKSGYRPRWPLIASGRIAIYSNVTQVSTAVRLRWTAAQMAIVWPGLDLLARSYARKLPGGIRYEYPFRIYPPPAGFDRGRFVPEMMDKVLGLWKTLRDRKTSGGRVQMDTFHLRAAAFAVRAYMDFLRMQKRRQKTIDDHSFQILKAKSKAVIPFLDAT